MTNCIGYITTLFISLGILPTKSAIFVFFLIYRKKVQRELKEEKEKNAVKINFAVKKKKLSAASLDKCVTKTRLYPIRNRKGTLISIFCLFLLYLFFFSFLQH